MIVLDIMQNMNNIKNEYINNYNIMEQWRQLEVSLDNELKKNFNAKIYRENDIKNNYGKIISACDHLIIIDKYFITIQDKWESSSPELNDIKGFIHDTEQLKTKLQDYKLIAGIFISKINMSENGYEIIAKHDNFIAVSNDNMNKLIGNTIDAIKLRLTTYNLQYNINNTLILLPHQKDAIDNFVKYYMNNNEQTGIISHPVGCGKTITAFALIGEFWKVYSELSVLWITKRKDVLHSQFADDKKIDNCINSNLLPTKDKFELKKWFNRNLNIDELSEEKYDMPKMVITNIDALTYRDYEAINHNEFGLIIVDECHGTGAELFYEFLKYTINEWKSLKHIVGFSATPIRRDAERFNRISELFGFNDKIKFIHRIDIIDAINDGLMINPTYYWIESKLDKNISYKMFANGLDTKKYNYIIKHIDEYLGLSYGKKAIAWASNCANADEWKLILESASKKEFKNLAKYKLFISHTKLKEDKNQLEKFRNYDEPALLICVNQCREGYDDPRIDVGINLDYSENIGEIIAIQSTGRIQRKWKDKNKCYMLDVFCLENEEDKQKAILNRIIGYMIFIKNADANNDDEIDLIYNFRIESSDGEIRIITNKNKIIKFNIISTELKSFNLDKLSVDVLTEYHRKINNGNISYNTAKKILSKSNITCKKDYYDICKKHPILPEDPATYFGQKFISWIDYLNIELKYYDLNKCKEMANVLMNEHPEVYKDLEHNYVEIANRLRQLDSNFPPKDLWIEYYNISRLDEIIKIVDISFYE